MSSSFLLPIVSVVAGICGGSVLGLVMATKTEMNARGIRQMPIDPLEVVSIRDALRVFFGFFIVLCSAVLVGFGILRLGSVAALRGAGGLEFAVSFIAGTLIAKFCRYLYWKSRL